MVGRDSAQLYTIEGFSAALIMLVTTWIVLGSTSVYTPGDTHISDMQLEQLGTDVLTMMDFPRNATFCTGAGQCAPHTNYLSGTSALQEMIANKYADPAVGPTLFYNTFLASCNNRTDGTLDHIQFTASVIYREKLTGETREYFFSKSRDLSAGDHAVRVTRWVLVDNADAMSRTPLNGDLLDHRPQEVLLEVLVWRG